MASAPGDLRSQLPALERQVKQLLNNDLKDICRKEGLQISGVKSVLQGRVLDQLRNLMRAPDVPRFEELKDRIQRLGRGPMSVSTSHTISASPAAYHSAPASHFPSQGPGSFRAQALAPGAYGLGGHPSYGMRLSFKPSPFWSLQDPLSAVVDMLPMGQSRNTAHTNLQFNAGILERMSKDKNIRVMLFCAVDAPGFPIPADIAFPAQIELKVNGEPYGGNLRGIKKKPGTTRPADITDLLRKSPPSYTNNVSLTYAATDKKYAFIIYLVRKHTVAELVERVANGSVISKERVLKEMNEKAKDEDIETTSTVMSLKCPLSFMRLQLPCRSTICSHNQCFDASSFLEVQEQAPQWNCPTCNKIFAFKDLAVDKYVQDILDSTPKSVDQVKVEPDGTWALADDMRNSTSNKRKATEAFDADDLIEVADPGRPKSFRPDILSTPVSFMNTPSREVSLAASTNGRSGSSKRPSAQVVDLTLSDDEDTIPRPVKRQSSSMNNMPSTYTASLLNGPPTTRPPSGGFGGFALPIQPHSQSTINSPGYPPQGSPYGAAPWR